MAKRITIAMLAVLLSAGAYADPPGGKGKEKAPPGHSKAHQEGASTGSPNRPPNDRMRGVPVTAGITAATASLLVNDLGIPRSDYKPLPPGIRKNLARGKPIPPGIARTRLPGNLVKRLPSYPGYEWIGAGTDLLLVEMTSQVIADVLIDVFR